MAAAPPPAPPPPPSSIPLPPTPIPVLNSKALDEQARSTMATIPPAPPPPSIPLPPAPTKNLLHGGVGWTADPGSEGCEMGTNSMGMVGGQDDVDGDDPQMGRDNDGKLQQCNNMFLAHVSECIAHVSEVLDNEDSSLFLNQNASVSCALVNLVSRVQVGEDELHTEKPHPKPRLKKSNNRKGDVPIGLKSASPRLRSPMQVASSPGVNMLARSEASRRALSMARSAALKRAKMEGCPETSQQSPSCTMTSPIPYLPHISPSIEDLSPGTRMTHSEASTRKRRKLISAIWTEATPIYRDGKLVKGRCVHCRQVFASARDTGTSSLKRHLKVFYTATVILSGSKYPTSHLHFYQFWKIKKMLNKEESNPNRKLLNGQPSTQDLTIARMIKQMQIKFNQYWIETYKSACIPVILDPRFKYDFLEFLLNDFGSEEEARKWMSEVKQIMEDLFDEYSKAVSIQSQRESDTKVEDDDDPLAKWDQYMKFKRGQSSNELDRYLKEDLTPRKEEVDILEWWKKSSSKYPVLSKMARDILAIPASTILSESAFSTGGRVISDYRSSLACSTIEALICLQDWFKAADESDHE